MFLFTFLAQHSIFYGEAFQKLVLLFLIFFQPIVFLTERVYDVQLLADKTSDERFLYIIATVYRLKKISKETFKVALVTAS